MFQKIKIEKLNKKGFLILFLIFIGLFVVAEPGSAFVFDPAKAAMAGLAELGGQLFAIFIAFFVALLASHWLVELSSHLLDWAMTLPVNLMADNELVSTGWTFIRDLVNLFFALALVAIAMAFILKIESFEIKKSLPRLIIIALLVNFSLLLVGAFIDIATILQNTILGEEPTIKLVQRAAEPLGSAWVEARGAVVGVITAWTIAAAIPYADAVKFIAQALLLTAFLPNFFHWILIIVFNTLIGLIFFLFFFLFLIRIIALWILAIFAPLALLAYILPTTQKYFHSWLKAVVSWAFLGIIALFLLTLGLRLIHAVMPAREEGLAGLILPWGLHDFAEFVIYYFFLLTFLIIAFVVSLKTAPTGADMAIKTAQSAIGGIAKVGIGTAIGHKLAGVEAKAGKWAGDRGEKGIEQGERFAIDAQTGKKKSWMSRAIGRTEQALSRPLSKVGRGIERHAETQRAGERERFEKNLKGLSSEEKVSRIESTTDEKELAMIMGDVVKNPGDVAHINEIMKEGSVLREQKANAEEWSTTDIAMAERTIKDGAGLARQKAAHEKWESGEGLTGDEAVLHHEWAKKNSTERDSAEETISKGEGLERQRDNANAWKDVDKKEAETTMTKASILTDKVNIGYGRSFEPDFKGSGDYKRMQNAFAVHLDTSKIPEKFRIDAELVPAKMLKRVELDSNTYAPITDIGAMARAPGKLGEETRNQISKIDASTLRSFEKFPIILNDILTVLRRTERKNIRKDAQDYMQRTAGNAY